MSCTAAASVASRMALSNILCPQEEPVTLPPAVQTLARISREESKQFFYTIGTSFEKDPLITIKELFQTLKKLSSEMQLVPILQDMVDQGFLVKERGGFRYKPTDKFFDMMDELREWSDVESRDDRAAFALVDVDEREQYCKEIVDLLEASEKSLGLTEISNEIDGINKVQVLQLLEALTKKGRLIETKDPLKRLWQMNPDYSEPDEPQFAAVKIPDVSTDLTPFTKLVLKTIYKTPGTPGTKLRKFEGYTATKLAYAVRTLINLNLIKNVFQGRVAFWYPFEMDIPKPRASAKVHHRDKDDSDLGTPEFPSPEFREKVLQEVQKHPFITSNELYSRLFLRAKYDSFQTALSQLSGLRAHRSETTVRWSVRHAAAANIDAMELPETHKKILRLIKDRPQGIIRMNILNALKCSEGVLTRALAVLQSCNLIYKEKTVKNACFYFGSREERDTDDDTEDASSSAVSMADE